MQVKVFAGQGPADCRFGYIRNDGSAGRPLGLGMRSTRDKGLVLGGMVQTLSDKSVVRVIVVGNGYVAICD